MDLNITSLIFEKETITITELELEFDGNFYKAVKEDYEVVIKPIYDYYINQYQSKDIYLIFDTYVCFLDYILIESSKEDREKINNLFKKNNFNMDIVLIQDLYNNYIESLDI